MGVNLRSLVDQDLNCPRDIRSDASTDLLICSRACRDMKDFACIKSDGCDGSDGIIEHHNAAHNPSIARRRAGSLLRSRHFPKAAIGFGWRTRLWYFHLGGSTHGIIWQSIESLETLPFFCFPRFLLKSNHAACPQRKDNGIYCFVPQGTVHVPK